ncbi:autotransporter-associated beta strand repeat-containing protein [Akkermansiaceae bacterium]|nr:autotransporter-associated beta strand repeat-containing protein [Akkermansiaceae bacterium]
MKTKIPHLILAGLFGTTIASYAGTFTWDGGGADGNWSTADNWAGNTAPVEADGWHTFVFDTSNQLNSNLDFTPGNNGLNINDITFASGAGAFTLSGSSIDMLGAASSGAADGIADITNNSANTQTINNNLIHHTGFNTGLTFNNTNGGAIVVDGVISQSNNQADDVTIQGNGTVTFNGVNTYTQDTILSSGTLVVGDSSALGTGTLTLNSGTLRTDTAAAGIALSNAIDASGTTNVFAGSVGLNLSGDITGSGTLVIGGSGSGQGSSGVSITDNLDGFTGKIRFDSVANLNSFSFGDGNTVNTTAALEMNGTNNKSNIRLYEHSTFGELSGNGGNFTGDNSTLTINQDTDTTFAGQLLDVNSSRELGFTKGGSGRLTLSGQNSYEWDTIVNGGTLEVSGRIGETERITVAGGAAFEVTGTGSLGSSGTGVYSGGGSGTGNIVNNGTFTYNSTTDQTFTGVVSGSGALIKDNSSTLTLSGANTFSGATTIDAGTLEIGGAGTLGSSSYAGTITNNGTLNYNSSATQTLNGVISGTGALILNGSGQLNLSVNNSFTGGVTVNNGTLALQNGGIGADGPLTVNGGYVNVSAHDGFDNLTVSQLSGTGGLIAVGRRTFTVNQNTDTAYAGVIQNQNGVGGNSPTTFRKIGTGTLTLTGLNTYNGGTTISGGGTLQVDGALSNGGTRSGITLNDNGSTLRVDGAGYLGPGGSFDKNIVMNNASIFDYSSSADQTLSGVISGVGVLNKDNASTLTLSGANTYSGNTTVSGGTLQIGGAGKLQTDATGFYSGDIAIASGATFQYSSSASNTAARYNGTISGDGTLIKDGSTSTLRLQGTTSVANIEINQGTLRVQGNADALGGAGTTVTVGASGSENAILNYSGSNVTYTDKTAIVVGAGSSGTKTIQNGAGTNNVENTNITLNDNVIIDDSGSFSLGGVISGTGGLTKTNSGTTTISVTNSYTGLTTVNEGTLVIDNSTGSARNFGAGDIEINNGATLQTTSTGGEQTRLQSRTITFGSSGGNTIDIGGPNTRVGGTTFVTTGGSTNFITGAAIDTSTSAIYNVSDGTDDVDLQVSSIIQRSGITKNGNGTLSLTNTNNLQSNAININAGTLEIAGAGKLINGGSDYSANINNDGIFKYNTTASQSFASIISGTGAIEKDNTSTLTLTGANSYSGNTTINNGTLIINGNQGSATGSMTINVSGTLGGSGTIGASLLTVNGVIAPGNSPGTLATGSQLWNDGGSYLWEINASNDAGGTIGTDPGWDWLDITGTLDLSLLSTGGFTIDIDSLTSGNIAGDAVGFDTWTKGNPGDVDYSFTIATASSGITGFDADNFTLDSSGFSNAPSWDWQIVLSGSDLVLEAYAVPEPSSTALLGLGGLALMLRRKRS